MPFWKDKPVLVTGVSGFVGSYLARELVARGARVHGFVSMRADRTAPKNLLDKEIEGDVTYHEGDIADLYSLLTAVEHAAPEVVFHLAAQSFVHRSFVYPLETTLVNCQGTHCVLEACRLKAPEATFVFAGSSEEYGMVYSSREQYDERPLFPAPSSLPELPITEANPLRPLSPYAASKVFGDGLTRQYHASYGLNAVVSRAFNHEGAGRGAHFVTSVIAKQVVELTQGGISELRLGNPEAFRDWSHVRDVIEGYLTVAERGKGGEVYNQGSARTNSVLTYLLLALEASDRHVGALATLKGGKSLEEPSAPDESEFFGLTFPHTRADAALLRRELTFDLSDEGIRLATARGDVVVRFDPDRFRPSDVPILLCDSSRVQALGVRFDTALRDIVSDQLNYFRSPQNAQGFIAQ